MQRRTLAALTAAALALAAMAEAGAEYMGSFAWASDDPRHGGWSAIEVSADGTAFTALSDRGFWIGGTLQRSAAGRVTAVQDHGITRLQGLDGNDIDDAIADSEGLAQDADGRLYVSFEGLHRVWRYAATDAPAEALPLARDFAGFQKNFGLDALAIGPDGALYTLPERPPGVSRTFPVYRFDGTRWTIPFTLPQRGDYLAVGADFGPDGRLYLLERHFAGLLGFTSRVRRFTLGTDQPAEELLLTTPVGRHGNLEGLAVWQDADGAIRLTMVADNNFRAFQRSEIVDYRLPPDGLDNQPQGAYRHACPDSGDELPSPCKNGP